MLLGEKRYVTGENAVCYWGKKFFKALFYAGLEGVEKVSTISTISTISSQPLFSGGWAV